MTNQEPASILLIDDHPMLRTGVKQLVSMAPDITVVGEASNGEQGIELAESLDPDLILLDLNMPGMNGLETLDKLREKSLSGRVVVFSVSNHEEDVVTALKRGADGYLLKDMEPEDLLKALQQAAAGEMVLSEALTPVLAASLRANRATSDRDVSQLTPRERDILKLIAQGLPNKMIARRLDITESTVKVHVKHMLKKMKLKSRVEAAVWVHQERIFKHYSSGSSFQRGSSLGNATSGCTTISVISLEETRWPFSSSTTADKCQRLVAPSRLSQAGIITLQPSPLLLFAGDVRLNAWVSPCQWI
jgi:two-component system nitrate/nitrite response regulator NarL